MFFRKKNVCKVFILVVLLGVLAIPAYSQKSGRVWLGIPLWASANIPVEQLNANIPNRADDTFKRIDLNVALQLMFPLGSNASIGPEVGVSYPPAVLVNATEDKSASGLADVLHIPVHLVINFAFSDNVSLDAFAGTNVSIRQSADQNLSGLVFDVGARLDIFNFLIHASYVLPFTEDLNSASASQTDVWDNSITFGIGYRFEI